MEELEEILNDYIDEYNVVDFPGQSTKHYVLFEENRDVVFNQLLQEVRGAGYEVFAFGKNRVDYPERITATFVEVDND